jgi:hypothetical protein
MTFFYNFSFLSGGNNVVGWMCDSSLVPSISVCLWTGVECALISIEQEDAEVQFAYAVVSISMREFGISGLLYPDLYKLQYLSFLDLSVNYLYGQIPAEYGMLNEVSHLDLSMNALSGDINAFMSNMTTSLTYLNLAINRITGTIPETIGSLTSLSYFGMNANQLTGPIPSSIGNMSMLKDLHLSGNRLSGQIPISIGSLELLEGIYIGANNFVGEIPTTFCSIDLKLLRDMYVFSNNNTLCYPECITLRKSMNLDLGNCNLC